MNILIIYESSQTFTNTVYEHLNSFGIFSENNFFFVHADQYTDEFNVDFSNFDAVGIHYCLRLPYDQVSDAVLNRFSEFKGLKFLFIQDEYDNTHRAWHWIKKLGMHLVFTVVPTKSIEKIYPPNEFPNVKFVSNLTGYVPTSLSVSNNILPPSKRDIVIGYRGRPLPIRYGKLGIEKVSIGQIVKDYCENRHIKADISWYEEDRIYGGKWYEFMLSCKAMLGSESGSNVFDWDGDLNNKISQYIKDNPKSAEKEIYRNVVKQVEIDGLMNQVSPKIFEAIAAKTVLVLFEGGYSDVVKPNIHYIELKKDGSNIEHVMALLNDSEFIDEMVERAWQDVIGSGKYSYKAFVCFVDNEIKLRIKELKRASKETKQIIINVIDEIQKPTSITTYPIKSVPVLVDESLFSHHSSYGHNKSILYATKVLVFNLFQYLTVIWINLPISIRSVLKPVLKPLIKIVFKCSRFVYRFFRTSKIN